MTKHEDCINSISIEWTYFVDKQMREHYKKIAQCECAKSLKDLTDDQLLDKIGLLVNITRTEHQELLYQAIKIELNSRHGESN